MMTLTPALPRDEIRVTTHRTVDTRPLETIVRDMIRLADAKTDDEKGIAIYTWQHPAILHCACCPDEKAPRSVGPLKAINVRGRGLRGGPATVLKALFETARYRGWSDPGHTTIEGQYGGPRHSFDVLLESCSWTRDRSTIAGQDDIVKDPSPPSTAPVAFDSNIHRCFTRGRGAVL